MRKVVVVMTYFERPVQLHVTLQSITKSAYPNFEVIIVDDGSTESPAIGKLPYPVMLVTKMRKAWCCSAEAINTGLSLAMAHGAEVILLQNAECYHVADVISYAARVTPSQYISFGCFSLSERSTFMPHNIFEVIQANNFGASHDGQSAWYNHPRYRPVGYHFASAVTAENMIKLNGFDERFRGGVGYEDDYFKYQVQRLGLTIEITELPFVVHQWHYGQSMTVANKAQLMEKNRQLYQELKQAGQYRAVHFTSADL
jgi:glycosyltransferase involved in cell wall biosynthesis